MNIEDYLINECKLNPDEKISTSDDSFWKLKDIIQNYIDEEGLVKNNVGLGGVIECSHPSTYWYFGDEARTQKHCANCGAKNIL